MAQTTFANGRGIAHKKSGGSSTVGPDICLTPVGQAVIPIPYINHARVSDVIKGTTTVKTDGAMTAVKGALYSKSVGDEPGTQGGIISGVNRNVAEFMLYSFDVKFEGKNVCRLGDPLFHNKKNIFG